MAGLVPAIHVLPTERRKNVDARHKAGHDGETVDGPAMRCPRSSTPSLRALAKQSSFLIWAKMDCFA